MLVRRLLIGSAALAIAAVPAYAQSDAKPAAAPAAKPAGEKAPLKGTWVGFADGQQGKNRVTVVFDSTGTDGWIGSMLIPQLTADSIPLEGVRIKADTLSFGFGVQGTPVGIRAVRTGNNALSGEIMVQGNVYGSIQMAKAGTAEAAELLSSPMFLDDRRR